MKNAILSPTAAIVLICLLVGGCAPMSQENSKDETVPTAEKITMPDLCPLPSDFELLSYRTYWDGKWLKVVGEIRNNGDLPGEPEIEAVARGIDGIVLDTRTFPPAGLFANIPPGETRTFSREITTDRNAKRVSVNVVSVFVWREKYK